MNLSAARYARTVRHLRPEQVLHRFRLRAQRSLFSGVPPLATRFAPPPPADWGWPAGFLPISGRLPSSDDAAAIARGTFTFLNEERSLGVPPDWQQPDAVQLWRYQLHYFEWAWALVDEDDQRAARAIFERLFRSWQEASPMGRWDAWSPYVASVRAWTFCGIFPTLVCDAQVERAVVRSLADHRTYLRWNLEQDVGGNHLVKNLKALIGLGVFLHDTSLTERATEVLERQLPVQILRDGGHYERSPSYHAQVLTDLVDVSELREAAGLEVPSALDSTIQSMRRWLAEVLLPDGDVPLLNDCTLVGPDLLKALGVPRSSGARLEYLRETGLVVCRPDQRRHIVIDVGPPCPPDLPAHAHADTLAVTLTVEGQRTFVDTGVSSYQDRVRRMHERSTSAHNTLEIDAHDSTEVFGTFRAGRRAAVMVDECRDDGTEILVRATHFGYRHLRGHPEHRRVLHITPDEVSIEDHVTGYGTHDVRSRWHVAPGLPVIPLSEREFRVGPVIVSSSEPMTVFDTEVATDFGRRERTSSLTVTVTRSLPIELALRIRVL